MKKNVFVLISNGLTLLSLHNSLNIIPFLNAEYSKCLTNVTHANKSFSTIFKSVKGS